MFLCHPGTRRWSELCC